MIMKYAKIHLLSIMLKLFMFAFSSHVPHEPAGSTFDSLEKERFGWSRFPWVRIFLDSVD